MKAQVYDITGKETKTVELDKTVFSAKVNKDLLAQAVRVYQGNQRNAAAQAKTRAQVARTTAKAFRQKGTGNARHGSKRAPIFVGGGKAHGPKDVQNYNLTLPKKMSQAALKSAFSLYASEKRISAVEGLNDLKKPSTKQASQFVQVISDKAKVHKISVILPKEQQNAYKSIRNIENVTCLTAESVTTYQVLRNKHIVFATEALEAVAKRLK